MLYFQKNWTTRFWRVQSNHLLIAHHFHRKCRTHNFNRVPHDQPSHLLPDRQHPGDLNQRGWQDRTTWSQWFQDFQVSLSGHPCCSSYRLVSWLAQSKPMVHMLDVWLQCRQVRGRCDRSTRDLENVLVILSHHLVGQLEMAGVHRRFTNVSVHQICKLLQLFHHTSLDVPVVTYLPKCFVEPGIPLQLLFMWPHLSLAFEGAGVIIWKYSSRGEWHNSLLSDNNFMLRISLCFSDPVSRYTVDLVEWAWCSRINHKICLRLHKLGQ